MPGSEVGSGGRGRTGAGPVLPGVSTSAGPAAHSRTLEQDGAGSLSSAAAPLGLRQGRPPPAFLGCGARGQAAEAEGPAWAPQSQPFREVEAAGVNSCFPRLRRPDHKTRTLSKWPQVCALPVSLG